MLSRGNKLLCILFYKQAVTECESLELNWLNSTLRLQKVKSS